jgi:hypothetical protein
MNSSAAFLGFLGFSAAVIAQSTTATTTTTTTSATSQAASPLPSCSDPGFGKLCLSGAHIPPPIYQSITQFTTPYH